MKKIIGLTVILVLITSCGGSDNGELTGVPGREKYFEPDPYGMVFIPQGSFNMGPSDQDVPWAENVTSKTVTVEAFWMDETEITNNEYRQFVYWVRDSIIRRMLAAQIEDFAISEDQFGNPIDPPYLNWETKIDYKDEEVNNILQELYLPPNERFFGRKELDTRKLMYEYYWIDLQQAANKNNRYNFQTKQYQGQVTNPEGQKVDITNRSAFVFRDVINVYPVTFAGLPTLLIRTMNHDHHVLLASCLCNYPVVGVTWKQATAFCIWRNKIPERCSQKDGRYFVHDYRLPT
jgi:hypothetical protein